MDIENFSFKDFKNVRLKALFPINIGSRQIQPGETIAFFDKILIAGLRENIKRRTANGGFDNRAHVFWDTTQDLQLQFTQGVMSKEQFALLTNANLIDKSAGELIEITERQTLESNEDAQIQLKHTPARNDAVWIYNQDTGAPVTPIGIDGKNITLASPYTTVIVDYVYNYTNGLGQVKIGQRLLSGFVELEGQTNIKDDQSGVVTTGIIKIPHLKLMSDLSIRLGNQASPITASFNAVGVPVGNRHGSYVTEFYFLNDDINSDID